MTGLNGKLPAWLNGSLHDTGTKSSLLPSRSSRSYARRQAKAKAKKIQFLFINTMLALFIIIHLEFKIFDPATIFTTLEDSVSDAPRLTVQNEAKQENIGKDDTNNALTITMTTNQTTTKMKEKDGIDCGCPHTCDRTALLRPYLGVKCGERIQFLMNKYATKELDACEVSSSRSYDNLDYIHTTNTNSSTEISEPQVKEHFCNYRCNPKVCNNSTFVNEIKSKRQNVIKQYALDEESKGLIKFQPKKYPGQAVIVTKVLHPQDLPALKQTICLSRAAYNRRYDYDYVVFTTLPWTEDEIVELQEVAKPANLTVVQDAPLINNNTEFFINMNMTNVTEINHLMKRCDVDVKKDESLSWFHYCKEEGYMHLANLGYAWQAEFRAYHLFKHYVLKKYKYMIWMDLDALASKTWEIDPIQTMVDNDLVLMIDNFQGTAKNPLILEKLYKAYNRTMCKLQLTQDGHFRRIPCNFEVETTATSTNDDDTTNPNKKKKNIDYSNIIHHLGRYELSIALVHGFFHVTNLDFYRNIPENINFLKYLISYKTHRFSREWDDQIAVTVPAAMLAPNRSWDFRKHGYTLGIHHNNFVDGKDKAEHGSLFKREWVHIKKEWHIGREMCDEYIVFNG